MRCEMTGAALAASGRLLGLHAGGVGDGSAGRQTDRNRSPERSRGSAQNSRGEGNVPGILPAHGQYLRCGIVHRERDDENAEGV